ncbi:MAG: Nif3-like dinuclear metal center hexameric protein [Kiritimatiellae bacterium]|nr:Nif3-like dinuclear metal center hexameric protein [Kiritimatiellia bacterium]
MKLERILSWLDRVLEPGKFDDVSNNGLQISRPDGDVRRVAFAVDGSLASVRAAAAAGAQLLVVHHGISWGGGIKRIAGGEYAVVKAAIDSSLALYAMHLPLDANRRYGNNREIARFLGLTGVRPAFSWHGNVIGVTGVAAKTCEVRLGAGTVPLEKGRRVGVCSGGAGEFASEAKALGCSVFVTGEASWGEVVAAENSGARMVCCGHYETETFGVKALAKGLSASLGADAVFVGRDGGCGR